MHTRGGLWCTPGEVSDAHQGRSLMHTRGGLWCIPGEVSDAHQGRCTKVSWPLNWYNKKIPRNSALLQDGTHMRVLFSERKMEVSDYRSQRSWGKVMFLQASVILLMGGCLPQCMLGYTPPRQTPQEQTPPWLEQTPPREQTPPA